MNLQITKLTLAHSPISIERADLTLKLNEIERQDFLKNSQLYMLVHREKLEFSSITVHKEGMFVVISNTKVKMTGWISHKYFTSRIFPDWEKTKDIKHCDIQYNKDEIKYIFDDIKDGNPGYVSLYPEDILFSQSRNENIFAGFDNWRDGCNYELLYIGISHQHNTFNRLIKNTHKAKTECLIYERPINPNALISEEIFILPFIIDNDSTLGVSILDSNASEQDIEEMLSRSQRMTEITAKTVRDAEKAFINIMRPPYNEQNYHNYPESTDGLATENLERYMFFINEDMSLLTEKNQFVGTRIEKNKCNYLCVDKNKNPKVSIGDILYRDVGF